MSARQSSAVDEALRLVAAGMTPYRAAKTVGIALSTIYRAQARQRGQLPPITTPAESSEVDGPLRSDDQKRMLK